MVIAMDLCKRKDESFVLFKEQIHILRAEGGHFGLF